MKFENQNQCHMIKGNESDVANIDFELQATQLTYSHVLHCFEIQRIAQYLLNQMSDCNGVWIKM